MSGDETELKLSRILELGLFFELIYLLFKIVHAIRRYLSFRHCDFLLGTDYEMNISII